MTQTMTTRPATDAEIAADAHKPAHRRTATVDIDTDARATVGRAHTVHRAEVWTYRNHRGDSVGRLALVACGAERYRNTRSAATACSSTYPVDCARCLAN